MKQTILFIFFTLALSGATFSQVKTDVKMIYWSRDKANCEVCDEITIDGNNFRIFNTPGIHLAVTASDVEKLIQVSVYLENRSSNQRIEFKPEQSVLALYAKADDKQPVEYYPVLPEQAAKKLGGNPKLKNFFTQLLAGLATQQTTVTSDAQGSVTVMGSGGIANGTYNEQRNSTITTPNRAAQEQAERTIAERNDKAKSVSHSILNWALRANTIFPKKELFGNIYFERKKGATMYVGIRVGDTIYLFAFDAPK